MKLKVLLSTLMIFTALAFYGQKSTDVNDIAKEKTEKLQTALDLTTDQNYKVYRQVYTYQSNLAAFNSLETKTDQQRESMKFYEDQFISEMKKILTEPQFADFTAFLKQKKGFLK